MEVANARHVHGATGCAEAAHLAVGAHGPALLLVSSGSASALQRVIRTYARPALRGA